MKRLLNQNGLCAIFSLVFVLCVCSAISLAQEKQVFDAITGDWEMETEFQGDLIPALMTLSIKDGKLAGVWVSMDQEMVMIDLEFDGKKLSFKRTMGEGGETIDFEGIVEGDEIKGKYLSPMGGEYKCTGQRKGSK